MQKVKNKCIYFVVDGCVVILKDILKKIGEDSIRSPEYFK